jgi:penicillin-binding protein A
VRRAAAVACCLLVVATACSLFRGRRATDGEAVVRRFVQAWSVGGRALADTITGADSPRLVDSLRGLSIGGVIRTTLVRASKVTDGSESFEGIVAAHFADDGRLELTIRASLEDDRVRAEPSAVSTLLSRWEPLRIERLGAPVRGDILSRTGALLARGPKDARVPVRPALAPAVSLIDEALDVRLAGRPERRLVAGEPPRTLAESPLADGEDVVTSLDDATQAAAEASLGRAAGALIAVDPRTGGIRALASNPESRAPDRPLASSAYSPGSAFKIVTAAAALQSGVLDLDDVVPCPGRISLGERTITNFESLAYGPITFEKAFAVSCNTAFAQIGVAVGTVRLLRTARSLGFRVVSELEGPGALSVPRSRGELAVWSFGAAGSLVSPIQMAGIGSTIARGGVSVSPGWSDRDDPGGRVLRQSTAAALVDMMEEVVETGTGRMASVPGARIAGKTGTAEPRREGARSDAWFVALAPSRDTRLVVVAFLPGAGIGGEAAAPLTKAFLIATAEAWKP